MLPQVLAAIVTEFTQNWMLVADVMRSANSMQVGAQGWLAGTSVAQHSCERWWACGPVTQPLEVQADCLAATEITRPSHNGFTGS